MMMSRNYQEVANEKEILEILGIKKDALTRLRKQGFPFVRLSRTSRVYIATDVLNWLQNRSKGEKDEVDQKVI